MQIYNKIPYLCKKVFMKAKLTSNGIPVFCTVQGGALVYESKEKGMHFFIRKDTSEDQLLDLVLSAMEELFPETTLREAFKWSIEVVEYLVEQQNVQIEEKKRG